MIDPATDDLPGGYRRRAGRGRRPAWPVLMTEDTVADYLDCMRVDGTIDSRLFHKFLRSPSFPKPDPVLNVYRRDDIDKYVARSFGASDPIQESGDRLDQRFGL